MTQKDRRTNTPKRRITDHYEANRRRIVWTLIVVFCCTVVYLGNLMGILYDWKTYSDLERAIRLIIVILPIALIR